MSSILQKANMFARLGDRKFCPGADLRIPPTHAKKIENNEVHDNTNQVLMTACTFMMCRCAAEPMLLLYERQYILIGFFLSSNRSRWIVPIIAKIKSIKLSFKGAH